MRLFLFSLLTTFFLGSCSNNKKEVPKDNIPLVKTDSLLVTDSSWGPIDRKTDFPGLEKIYGKANLKDVWICGAECLDTVLVTKIFEDMPGEMVVFWRDSAFHKKIARIENYKPGSPYHTNAGLKNGSTLNDLLKANGQKISFSGFGWDYGGGIISYNKGKLDSSSINFRLDISGSPSDSLFGDTELDTDMPLVKKVLDNVYSSYISLSFYED